MKKTLATLSIVLLVTSCAVLDLARGFDDLTQIPPSTEPAPVQQEESLPILSMEEYEALLMDSTEDSEPTIAPIIVTDDGITPSEPSFTESEEITPIPTEEAVELFLGASEQTIEPMPLPSDIPDGLPSGELRLPSPDNLVHLGENTILPMWFVYTSAGLIVACLFTICYISKQRKETYWKRFRD